MKLLRRLHLFLGCFFSPLLIFYVLTGCYQTVSLDRKKGLGEAENWLDRMQAVHVDQVYPTDSAAGFSPQVFQALVVLMSVALLVSVALGIFLAFRVLRHRWLIWLSLGLGVLVPIVALWLGQRH